jgi:hypothetical protein
MSGPAISSPGAGPIWHAEEEDLPPFWLLDTLSGIHIDAGHSRQSIHRRGLGGDRG